MPPLLLFFWLLVLSNRAPVPVAALAVAPYWSLRHCAYIQRRLIRRCIPARSGAAFAVAFASLRRLPLRVIAPRSGAVYVASAGFGAEYVASASAAATALPPLLLFLWLLFLLVARLRRFFLFLLLLLVFLCARALACARCFLFH